MLCHAQVYKGRLFSGEAVAVKVQRPGVLETVTVDLFIIRRVGLWLRTFPSMRTDLVALLDEWAVRPPADRRAACCACVLVANTFCRGVRQWHA
jgi:hypothetical protein